jgi:hypothetical protein
VPGEVARWDRAGRPGKTFHNSTYCKGLGCPNPWVTSAILSESTCVLDSEGKPFSHSLVEATCPRRKKVSTLKLICLLDASSMPSSGRVPSRDEPGHLVPGSLGATDFYWGTGGKHGAQSVYVFDSHRTAFRSHRAAYDEACCGARGSPIRRLSPKASAAASSTRSVKWRSDK